MMIRIIKQIVCYFMNHDWGEDVLIYALWQNRPPYNALEETYRNTCKYCGKTKTHSLP